MRRADRITLVSLLICLCAGVPHVAFGDESPPPLLDSPSARDTGASHRATGTDPAAPRPLVLWSWDGRQFSRLASTRSDSQGRFDFGEQPLTALGVYFQVSALGSEPTTEHLLHIERPLPAPVILLGGLDPFEITVAPAYPGGELRIYDAETGRLLLRKSLEPTAAPSASIDLRDELPQPCPTALAIEQVMDDGRRSERQSWRLD